MNILSIGPLWRGSNAGGLFRALSRQGCIIETIDEFYYVSLQSKSTVLKIFEKTIRPLQEKEFNTTIRKKIQLSKPDILFIYKGAFVQSETLEFAKKNKCKLALFYPDVSLTFHGKNIPASIPLYDIIFTTKTFGIDDLSQKFGVKNSIFIPHGFDPEMHRKLAIDEKTLSIFGCDVSFIGAWSPKKEKILSLLKEKLPQINLKIWGDLWNRANSENIISSIQGNSVLGDLYALAIQCSKINLGILSEKVSGASSGDLITSRTFHIPGASGFMLHEKNIESIQYFKEDEEVVFFEDSEDLVNKITYYLNNPELRTKIQNAGYQRALLEHSLDSRAKTIIKYLKNI